MGNWKWEGFGSDGKRTNGVIDAQSEREVKKALRAMGVRPKKITPPSILEFDFGEWMVAKGLAAPFGAAELSIFTKQFSVMVNAGVPLLQSIDILGRQQKNMSLRKSLKNIHNAVAEGKTLAEAMSVERGFTKLYCNLVRAGEAGGILDTILRKLADHLEKQEKTKRQLKSAMMYPGVVTVVGLAVVWGMMMFVVPEFQSMLKDTGQETPFITQFVIDISKFLQNWSLYLVPLFIATVVALNYYRKTPVGKEIFDRFMMRLIIFGPIIIKGNLSSFFRTLSTMISSGVSLIDALQICSETVDNVVVAADVGKIKKAVETGKNFTDPLMKIKYAPDMIAQMIKVGEQTGSLDDMMIKVSELLEEEVDTLVSGMTKMVEPIILVVLGGIVAVILVAMYMPIFMSAGGSM